MPDRTAPSAARVEGPCLVEMDHGPGPGQCVQHVIRAVLKQNLVGDVAAALRMDDAAQSGVIGRDEGADQSVAGHTAHELVERVIGQVGDSPGPDQGECRVVGLPHLLIGAGVHRVSAQQQVLEAPARVSQNVRRLQQLAGEQGPRGRVVVEVHGAEDAAVTAEVVDGPPLNRASVFELGVAERLPVELKVVLQARRHQFAVQDWGDRVVRRLVAGEVPRRDGEHSL